VYTSLLKAITPQTLILTPSQALRDQLVEKLPEECTVLAIHTYLLKLWEACNASKILLSEFQEWQLWQEIIAQSNVGKTLLNLPNTAKIVQEAWILSAEWHLPPLSESVFLTDETNQFIKWSTLFQTRCDKEGWISRTHLIPELLSCSTQLSQPSQILLINFDKLNPQTAHFFEALNIPYSFVNLGKMVSPLCYRFPDIETEWEAMAAWAKQHQQINSKQSIQCVVPELYKQASNIERAFRKVFNIPLPVALPVTVLSPSPLSRSPLVKIALFMLALRKQYNPINQLTEILLSPFIGESHSEGSARAKLDMTLRRLNLPELSWDSVLFYARKNQVDHFVKRIEDYVQLKTEKAYTEETLSQWADYFTSVLRLLGWPGERPLSDKEKENKVAFEKVLTQLSDLTPNTDQSYTESGALALLQQFLNNHLGEESRPPHPIQILDLKEAAQLPCDVRWVCGLHNEVWPGSPRPNPFLPYSLQSEKELPHSSYQNELSFAKQITTRLRQTAAQVIFSFPESNQDVTLTMSPLLKGFPCHASESWHPALRPLPITPILKPHPQSFEEKINSLIQCNNSSQLPSPSSLDASGMSGHDKTLITQGGSGILKSQAACPFQAFAKYRLKAEAPQTPSPYLDALDRGQLLHLSLEYFWEQVQDQATLRAYTEKQLSDRLRESIDQAFLAKKIYLQKCPTQWLAVETQCLISLLHVWLEVERQRPPFSVIAREQKQTVALGNLHLNLTVDRIDRLENGDTIVIDYKTGQTKISAHEWQGDRPKEPQLPLYCLALTDVRGSLIAQLRAEGPRFTGITEHPSDISGVESLAAGESWEQTVENWSQTLELLAEEFSKGYAAVAPREEAVCQTCDFSSLCRIHEKIVQ
jgi:ATP-dependent helicase/nuclease subunit B